MEKDRTLKDLTLKDEDYIFGGNLTVVGNLNLDSCSIIISGKLKVIGNIFASGGDIVCDSLDCGNIYIRDGDVCVRVLSANNIDSDGNVEVYHYVYYVGEVTALNYLVMGDNGSLSINAMQDVYILGNNDSYEISARDVFISGENNSFKITASEVFIGGSCDLGCGSITAKRFTCNGRLIDCNGVTIK